MHCRQQMADGWIGFIPQVENRPPSHQKTCNDNDISITLTRCVLQKARRCPQHQQDTPPLPTTPPDMPCAYDCVGRVYFALPPSRALTEKIDNFSHRCAHADTEP